MQTSEPSAMPTRAYERDAGSTAILAGLLGIVYSVAFLGGVVLGWAPELGLAVASIALIFGALFSIAVLIAVFQRLDGDNRAVGTVGLVLVVVGAAGAMAHGGYDLANVLHPPVADVLADAELPNPVDPRGLLTFAISGLGLLILAAVARGTGVLSGGVATLGMVVGAMLLVVYLGRLVILTPTNPLVAAAAGITGLVLSPAFYIWLGMELRRR
ncbi:MAG TPA: hypothetical protein VFK61_03840 [Candidatus Limnocylindria bacterium]|jgi:hypothetical protein|nr:hypothetical protein [Candidatus Limnocylindria bacterium]